MITLPNGDKWIIDYREIDAAKAAGITHEEQAKGNIPETTMEDFLDELLHRDDHSCFLPHKLVVCGATSHWFARGDPCNEVLAAIAVKSIKNAFSNVHEMPSGEVHVIYDGADLGGYDVETKVVSFASRDEYMKAVSI